MGIETKIKKIYNAGTFLEISIRSKRGLIFAGKAGAVSAQNASGPFDILPMHSNFITIILNGVTVYKKSQEGEEIIRDEFPAERGIIKVAKNKVDIFLSV